MISISDRRTHTNSLSSLLSPFTRSLHKEGAKGKPHAIFFVLALQTGISIDVASVYHERCVAGAGTLLGIRILPGGPALPTQH